MRKLLVLVALLFPLTAFGAFSFEITFTEPTERVDGQPFDAANEADFYVVQCDVTGAFSNPLEEIFARSESVPSGEDRYYLWENAVQTGGWYYCRMNVTDVDGQQSDWSNITSVRKTAKPNPPVMR